MTEMVTQVSGTLQDRSVPARKHRWLRWVLAGLVMIVVLAFAGTYAFIHIQSGPVPAPLALPKLSAVAAGTGSNARPTGPGQRGPGHGPATGSGRSSSGPATRWPAGPAR